MSLPTHSIATGLTDIVSLAIILYTNNRGLASYTFLKNLGIYLRAVKLCFQFVVFLSCMLRGLLIMLYYNKVKEIKVKSICNNPIDKLKRAPKII